jgi:hypothetical protein
VVNTGASQLAGNVTSTQVQALPVNGRNLSYNPATGTPYPFSDVSPRPFPGWGIVQQAFSGGKSNYHCLETAFSRRMTSRWQASATYTLSDFTDYTPPPFSGRSEVSFPVPRDLGE